MIIHGSAHVAQWWDGVGWDGRKVCGGQTNRLGAGMDGRTWGQRGEAKKPGARRAQVLPAALPRLVCWGASLRPPRRPPQ